MVIRFVLDCGELVKVPLLKRLVGCRKVGGGKDMEATGFCGPCVCLGVFRCLCQGLRGAGVCIVGTVGWSAGGKCVGGRGSVVTGWERIGGGGEDRGKSE
jgi:hypothetical protein